MSTLVTICADSSAPAAGVVFEKYKDGEGKLSIFFDVEVPDELKVVFIEFVHQHLQKYARDLRRERRYVCTNIKCGKPFNDIEAIKELLDSGATRIICQRCRTDVELIDHIEQCLTSDPVAKQVVAMDETATRELSNQSLEQILEGHMKAILGQAGHIYRERAKPDFGIDGEIEFYDRAGKASGKLVYVQLKSGDSYLRQRQRDGKEIFDVKDERHLEYWVNHPADVYLVIRDSQEAIRWMNVTHYLKTRDDKKCLQIKFDGEKFDEKAIWRKWDEFFPRPMTSPTKS